MAPGQMSSLAQSGETAFRVKFDGPVPPQAQLYWRGPVLGAYDGQTWTRVRPQHRGRERQPPALTLRGQPVRYQVTLEPSNTRWLFALEMPDQLPDIEGNLSFVSPELELLAAYPVESRVRYQLASYVDFRLEGATPPGDGQQWLLLPYGRNPRALAAGRELRTEPDPAKRVQALLRRFTREPFVYTLEPPLLGADSVDEFLYTTRAGFCEHYAGAFVFLMRAAGVPARVVTGYQGGELNPVDGYLTVRQSDAHAWAEVWLAGRGWTRVDPTAAVAPERVRRGLAQAIPPGAPFGIEGLGRLMRFEGDQNALLAQLRYSISALNNGWDQWVLNYTPQRQRGLLERLKASLSDWRPAALLALACALLLGVGVWRKRQQGDPIDALYSALCQRLGQLGVARGVAEGPSAYAQRVARAGLGPERQAAATEFLRRYSAWRYAPRKPDASLVATLKSLLSQLR
jgi:transglutaminase-like putative cysteine protease